MKLIKLLPVLLLLFFQTAVAKVKLPAIVSSNMVLQRDTTIVLWGWADAEENISIEVSWLTEPLNLKADKDGIWKINIKTTKSKAQQTIKIKSEESDIVLNNILFGEVWLCSGQSNMQQPLKGYQGQPTFGGNMAVANSNNPNLRLFSVDRVGSKTPLEDIKGYTGWEQASTNSTMNFSAIAFFYGQQLQKILDVPVGMIHTSWGGSVVEAWMSNEVLSGYQTIDLDHVDITEKTNHIPTALFNAMIKPLIPFTIKGALFYQGESNRLKPKEYKERFPAMVKDWRTRWEIGDFPFYYVQIAPFIYDGNNEYKTTKNSAFIREAQLHCLDLIPNSGMAVTMDIGDDYCIHPPKKKDVADRLLFNALNKTYGFKSIAYSGPIYKSKIQKDKGLVLSFSNADSGIFAHDKLEGFEIAGEDKVFYPAEAEIINRKEVFVKSNKVPSPIAVRYAWKNWVVGTLYDTNLLPASSFRTDNWDDAVQYKKE